MRPAVLLALSCGVWFCYDRLDAGGSDHDFFGGRDSVHASDEFGLPALGLSKEGAASGLTSGREQIEIVPWVDPAIAEAAALAAEEEREGTRLRGTVVRAGGVAVAGASLVARKSQRWFSPPADVEDMDSLGTAGPRFEAVTDEAGEFVLYDVPAGKLALSIRAAGLAPVNRTDLEIPEHEDYDLGRFSLELGIRLSGRVVGLRGKGVEGVQVLCAVSPDAGSTRLDLPGRGSPLTSTDADGRFEVDTLAPGAWHLIFDSPQYRLTEEKGQTDQPGGSERGLLITLDQGLSIQGKLIGLDPVSEGPLRVTARRNDEQPSGAADDVQGVERHRARHADVRADGTFEVLGLAPGVQYKLALYRQEDVKPDAAPGVTPRWRKVRGVDDLEEMAGGRQVEFKYRQEALVLLQVKNSATDAVVENFLVSVTGSGLGGGGILEDEAGEDRHAFPGGAVRYDDLLPAENGSETVVRVRAEGFEDFEKKGLMLRPGEELDLGECKLDPAPMGSVTVVDDETGAPIEEARVLCTRAGDSSTLDSWANWDRARPLVVEKVRDALTDAEGVARLTLWKGNICSVKAVAEGYQSGEAGRLVPPYDQPVEIRLTRGGAITVRVIDGRGAPIAGMYIEHKVDDKNINNNHGWDLESRQENKTGENGEVVFKNLAQGKHSFSALEKLNAWGRGGESAGFEAEGDVFLAEGETSELELRVESRGGLGATILESGTPLAGALVKVTPVEGGSQDNGWYWGGGQEDPRSKISDHGGRVKFEGIRVGRYVLSVSHPDRRMVVSQEVMISTEPDQLMVDVGLAIVEGRVVDPAGEPIEHVSITVQEKGRGANMQDMGDYRVRVVEDEDGDADWDVEQVKQWSISTDREGRFVLRGVTPESLLVVYASHSYVVGASRDVGPLGGEEYVMMADFVVERAGAIRIDMPETDRQTRGKYLVALARMEGEKELETRSTRMRSWRSYVTINSLRPGKWILRLRQDGQDEVLIEREVTVQVADTQRVTLQL